MFWFWFGLGMTSEGGGAVAFPVMTLAFSIPPSVARDFSVMIQSCGMSAASFTILFMRIRCEWRALAFSSLGGLIGLILGLEIIDDRFTPKEKKLGFREHLVRLRFRLALPNRFQARERPTTASRDSTGGRLWSCSAQDASVGSSRELWGMV